MAEPSASQSLWAEIASEGGVYNLFVGSAIKKCVRARLFTVLLNAESLARSSQQLNSPDHCLKVSGSFVNRPITWKWNCVIARCPHGRYHPLALHSRSRQTCSIQTCRTSSVRRNWAGDERAGGPLQWATHTEFPNIVKLHELNCCAILLTAAGGGSVFAVFVKALAGLDLGDAGRRGRRSPRRWIVRSCTSFGLVPGSTYRDCFRPRGPAGYSPKFLQGSFRFSPDGRLPHTPSLVRLAAWDERLQRNRRRLCIVRSAEEEHAGLKVSQWSKARSAKKAAKRPPPSGIAALPPERQCQAEFQATVLSQMEDFAGRLAALEVSGVTPIPTTRGSALAMLRIPAASRKTSGPTLHEARGGPAAFVFRSSQFATSPETRARSRRNSKWVGVRRLPKWSTPKFSTAADQEKEGSSDRAVMHKRSAFCAPVTSTLELSLRSVTQRSTSFCTVVIFELYELDEERFGGFERQHVMLCQKHAILESGAKDNGHDLVWG